MDNSAGITWTAQNMNIEIYACFQQKNEEMSTSDRKYFIFDINTYCYSKFILLITECKNVMSEMHLNLRFVSFLFPLI